MLLYSTLEPNHLSVSIRQLYCPAEALDAILQGEFIDASQ